MKHSHPGRASPCNLINRTPHCLLTPEIHRCALYENTMKHFLFLIGFPSHK